MSSSSTPEAPQVVILAGGLATRLRPLTHSVPKALVPIAGRPFLDYQLEWLSGQGAHHIVILLGHLGEQIVEHVGDGAAFGLQVRYHWDGGRLLGTGGALRGALALLEPAFVVLNGDTFVDFDLPRFWQAFVARDWEAGLAVCDPALLGGYANVTVDDDRVVAYEKSGLDPACRHGHLGVAAFRASAVARLPVDEPVDLGALLNASIAAHRVLAWHADQPVYDIGTPAGLARFARVVGAKASPMRAGAW
jgi:NDP-sugar pyrophosphorylase family protein